MAGDLLQGALEDNLLCMLCWDEEHAPTLALRLPPEIFSTRAYSRIAEQALGYMERYHRPPGVHLRDLLEGELRRGEEGRFLSQVLDAMDGLREGIQPDYVLGELDRFIEIRKLTQAVSRAADSLHAGDLEDAREALADTGSAASDLKPGVFLHDTDDWLQFLRRDQEGDLFSSGVDVLDERGVRPRRGSLFLIMASAGRGKSFWLRQIAKQAVVEHHKKVLHITLENDLDETLMFYTMAFLGMTSEQVGTLRVPLFEKDELGRFLSLNFNQVTPEVVSPDRRAQIAQALRPYQARGKLFVQWFPTGSLTIGQLSAFLSSLEHTRGFRPDMLVLDYADLMHTDARDLRISTGRLYRDLRGLAGTRDMAVVTATQGNRSSADARVVTTSMIAEDWSKVGTADTVLTYSQTLDERELGLARVLVAKSRRSRDRWIALITQSYATGQFALDSVFMSKLAQSEISRHLGEDEDE